MAKGKRKVVDPETFYGDYYPNVYVPIKKAKS